MSTDQSNGVSRARRNEVLREPRINSKRSRDLLQINRVQEFMQLCAEGVKWKEAALQCKIRIKRAKQILSHKSIRDAINAEIEVVAERERPRNILLRQTIRDKGLEPDATAAQQKNALEAARQLEGSADGTTININGSNNNVIAGYVMKIDGPDVPSQAITNRHDNDAKSLKTINPVTDDVE